MPLKLILMVGDQPMGHPVRAIPKPSPRAGPIYPREQISPNSLLHHPSERQYMRGCWGMPVQTRRMEEEWSGSKRFGKARCRTNIAGKAGSEQCVTCQRQCIKWFDLYSFLLKAATLGFWIQPSAPNIPPTEAATRLYFKMPHSANESLTIQHTSAQHYNPRFNLILTSPESVEFPLCARAY